jgi:hypothetical protein
MNIYTSPSTPPGASGCLDAFLQFPRLSELFDCFLLKLQDKSAREETVVALVLLCQDALAHDLKPTRGGGNRTLDEVLLSTALKMLEPLETASRGAGSAWTSSSGQRARRRIARSCEQYFSLLVHLILLPTSVSAPRASRDVVGVPSMGVPSVKVPTEDDAEAALPALAHKQSDKVIRKLESLYARIIKSLHRHKPLESAESHTRDHIMIGLMQTARAILRRVPHLASRPQPEVVDLLYVAFLFPPLVGTADTTATATAVPMNTSDATSGTTAEASEIVSGRPVFETNSSSIVYAPQPSTHKNTPKPGDAPRAVSSDSRRTSYALLVELCEHSASNLEVMLELLQQHGLGVVLHLEGHEAEDLRQEWNFNPQEETRGPLQYAGLRNLGATCYMNSLLQQLYMVPSFRRAFSSLPLDGLNEDSLVYQIQVMFGALNMGSKHYYDTRPFCGVLQVRMMRKFVNLPTLKMFTIYIYLHIYRKFTSIYLLVNLQLITR